jgi:hypothetical protein
MTINFVPIASQVIKYQMTVQNVNQRFKTVKHMTNFYAKIAWQNTTYRMTK